MTSKKIGKRFLTIVIASVITISLPFLVSIRASELSSINASVVSAVPTIISVDNIRQTVFINDSYMLPKIVTATMSDESTNSVVVKWNSSKANTSSAGAFNYFGTVVGHNKKVNFELTVIPIKSIDNIIEIVYLNDSYTLPTTLIATMDDESTKSVSVKWSSSKANTSKAGESTYTGTVTGYSKKVKLQLTVIPIKSIENVSETVNLGDNYTLPTILTATMGDGSTKSVALKWSPSQANTSNPGTSTYSGTVAGYSNKVNLILRVNPIISINAEVSATVNVNDNYTLPKTVTATMGDNDRSTKQVAVTWSPSKATTTKAGVFNYTGTVTGYRDKIKFVLNVNPITLINATVNINWSYTLPSKVTATLSDGTTVRDTSIVWDSSIVDTSKLGTYTYMGTLNGYTNRVKLILKVEEGNTIKSVKFKTIGKPTYSRTYTLDSALSMSESLAMDPSVNDIILSELISKVVRLDLNNVAGTTYNALYIDKNADGDYDKGTDHIVGQFTITATGNFRNTYINLVDGIKVVSGDKGIITFKVYNADATKVRGYTSVSVDF